MTKSHALILVTLGAVAACSSDSSTDGRSVWTCNDLQIANGSRLECVGKVQSAFAAASYTCTATSTAVECPPLTVQGAGTYDANAPPTSGGTGDDDGVFASSDGTTVAGSSGASGSTAPAAGSDTTTGAGSPSGASGAGGSTNPPIGSDATSVSGSSGSAGSSGSSSGSSSGEIGPPASSASTSVAWKCNANGDDRRCRKAPRCDAGATAVGDTCVTGASASGGSAPITSDSTSATGPRFPGAGGGAGGLSGGATLDCYYPVTTGAAPAVPAATVEYVLEALQGAQQLHVRVTFNPDFVDNTYGANAIGWTRGHKFNDLVGSDHVELSVTDEANAQKLDFKLDYISQATTAPSGYAALGVSGGDGKMVVGAASSITKWSTSLDRNMNERGYKSYVVDSPPTDAKYTAPAAAPLWDYRVVYEAWIDNAAFGAAGFGSIKMTYVHASPSKASTNTVDVEMKPCPPDWHD